ncbi:unnamed protein product [Knipowitschia caucasica]
MNGQQQRTSQMPSVHIVEGPTIWIIGDSYVRRGRDRAAETLGHNLGMAAHVQWFGRGGLRWSSLVPWLFRLLRGRSAPAVLLICCGSNDLGKVKSVDLVAAMKRDLLDLHRRYPSMDIFFSQLTDRRLWRDAQPGRINRAKRFINNVLKNVCEWPWRMHGLSSYHKV